MIPKDQGGGGYPVLTGIPESVPSAQEIKVKSDRQEFPSQNVSFWNLKRRTRVSVPHEPYTIMKSITTAIGNDFEIRQAF